MDNRKQQEKKKSLEEVAGEKLFKIYCGKEGTGHVLSYHNFLLDPNGLVKNPLPAFEKRQAQRLVSGQSKPKQNKDKSSEITVNGIYGRFRSTVDILAEMNIGSTPDGKPRSSYQPELLTYISEFSDKDFYEIPIFIPLLNIYGNVQSLAFYIAKNVTPTRHISPTKYKQGSTINLSDDNLRQIIASRLIKTIHYAMTGPTPSPFFLSYRNLITQNGNLLTEDQVEVMFLSNQSAEKYAENLDLFIDALFYADGKSKDIEISQLETRVQNFEELLVTALSQSLLSMTLKQYAKLERQIIESGTVKLNIKDLLTIGLMSCVKSVQFSEVPTNYKKIQKVEGGGEDETEEEYLFVNTKLTGHFAAQTKFFVQNGYVDGITAMEQDNSRNIDNILKYSTILTFKPVSTVFNVRTGSSGSSGIQRTVLELLFQRFRSIAGYKLNAVEDDSEKTEGRKQGDGPWFENLLQGLNTLNITSFKIDRTAATGRTKIVGLVKGEKDISRAFADERNLDEGEIAELRTLIAQEDPDLENERTKRLLLRLIKARSSIDNPSRQKRITVEKEKEREEKIEKRATSLQELFQLLGSSFEGFRLGSGSSNFTISSVRQTFEKDAPGSERLGGRREEMRIS